MYHCRHHCSKCHQLLRYAVLAFHFFKFISLWLMSCVYVSDIRVHIIKNTYTHIKLFIYNNCGYCYKYQDTNTFSTQFCHFHTTLLAWCLGICPSCPLPSCSPDPTLMEVTENSRVQHKVFLFSFISKL